MVHFQESITHQYSPYCNDNFWSKVIRVSAGGNNLDGFPNLVLGFEILLYVAIKLTNLKTIKL